MNCGSLESIHIGEKSFHGFAGEFELKNLPKLQSIEIGSIKSKSNNFRGCSFVIRGTLYDIEYDMMIDLPNLQYITLGSDAFHNSLSTIIESIE